MPLPLLSYQQVQTNHSLTLPQYYATAKQQVTFTAGIRDMLRTAAQDIVEHPPSSTAQS